MSKLGVENNNWTRNQVDAYALGYDPDSVHSMNSYYEHEDPERLEEYNYHSKQDIWSSASNDVDSDIMIMMVSRNMADWVPYWEFYTVGDNS